MYDDGKSRGDACVGSPPAASDHATASSDWPFGPLVTGRGPPRPMPLVAQAKPAGQQIVAMADSAGEE